MKIEYRRKNNNFPQGSLWGDLVCLPAKKSGAHWVATVEGATTATIIPEHPDAEMFDVENGAVEIRIHETDV